MRRAPPPSAKSTGHPGGHLRDEGLQLEHMSSKPRAVPRQMQRPGWPPEAVPSLVGDLHAKRFFIFVFVVVDVDQNLLHPSSLTRCKPQANSVGLSPLNLEASIGILVPTLSAPLPLPATSVHTNVFSQAQQATQADRILSRRLQPLGPGWLEPGAPQPWPQSLPPGHATGRPRDTLLFSHSQGMLRDGRNSPLGGRLGSASVLKTLTAHKWLSFGMVLNRSAETAGKAGLGPDPHWGLDGGLRHRQQGAEGDPCCFKASLDSERHCSPPGPLEGHHH